MRLTTLSDGGQEISLPLALPRGESLRGFRDAALGIEWAPALAGFEGGSLTIPLLGEGITGTLSLRLGVLQGDGVETRAKVNGVELSAGPVRLTGSDAGEGAVRLTAALGRVPEKLVFRAEQAPISDAIRSALDETAKGLGVAVGSVAFALKIEAGFGGDVRSATVSMSVDPAWEARWRPDGIRIARISDSGATQLLQTSPAGRDADGRARFQAASIPGFSTLVLLALASPAGQEEPGGGGAGPIIGGALGGAAVLALAAGLALRWRRRRHTAP